MLIENTTAMSDKNQQIVCIQGNLERR